MSEITLESKEAYKLIQEAKANVNYSIDSNYWISFVDITEKGFIVSVLSLVACYIELGAKESEIVITPVGSMFNKPSKRCELDSPMVEPLFKALQILLGLALLTGHPTKGLKVVLEFLDERRREYSYVR